MSCQRNFAATIGAAVLCAACASSPTTIDADESLISALRSTGFQCADLISTQALDEQGASWRIVCTDTRAYLASFEIEGEICFSPVPYLAPPGLIDAIVRLPPEAAVRCATPNSREG